MDQIAKYYQSKMCLDYTFQETSAYISHDDISKMQVWEAASILGKTSMISKSSVWKKLIQQKPWIISYNCEYV